MKNGTGPTRDKLKDYGWIETHGERLVKRFGSLTPQFPPTLGRTLPTIIPNQNVDDAAFTPPVLREPYGCTNESQTALKRLMGGTPRPDELEAVTHANARGGFGVTDSLDACLPPSPLHPERLGYFDVHFNIRVQGGLDPFDAARLAMMDGLPEYRGVSIGSPWFPEFENTKSDGILPTPPSFNTAFATWHNWLALDWKMIGDQPYLICLSWQGAGFGDKGFHYVSRTLFNTLMDIYGSTMRIPADRTTNPQPITINTWEWLISLMRYVINLRGYAY